MISLNPIGHTPNSLSKTLKIKWHVTCTRNYTMHGVINMEIGQVRIMSCNTIWMRPLAKIQGNFHVDYLGMVPNFWYDGIVVYRLKCGGVQCSLFKTIQLPCLIAHMHKNGILLPESPKMHAIVKSLVSCTFCGW